MLKKIYKITLFLLLISSVGLLFASYRYPQIAEYIRTNIENLTGTAPCQKPITYYLGSFDNDFGISKEDFLSAISEASAIWGKTLGKELFKYSPDGKLKISLIYDYRQEATDKLQGLGLQIDSTKNSYENLKAEYLTQKSAYDSASSALNSRIAVFQYDTQKLNSEISYWNKKGGAPKDIYNSLNAESDRLKSEAEEINIAENNLNKQVAIINALVDAMNMTAHNINLTVQTFNKIGASTGEEFSEGLYVLDATGASISVYQFNNRDQLVRLLAHELGHALGLEHVADPKAIMYRLNESKNIAPTKDDIAELKAVCHINN